MLLLVGEPSRVRLGVKVLAALEAANPDAVEEEARGGGPGWISGYAPGWIPSSRGDFLCLPSPSWLRSLSSPCSVPCPGRQLRLPRLCRRISGDSYIDLHQHPELSLHEEKTAAKVGARLRQPGFEVTTGIGGTRGVGVLKNGDDPAIHSLISMSGPAGPPSEWPAFGVPGSSSLRPTSDAERSTAMILPLIAQLQCLFAQPWRQALVYLADPLRYNPFHEIAVQEPRHAFDPFAGRSSESLMAALEPGIREKAQGVCTAAGVKPLLEACTLDVAVIGQDAAAKVFVDAIPPAAVGTIAGGGGGILEKWWWLWLVLLAVIVMVWFLMRKKP